jgi:TonB-dependent receptor
MFSCDNVKRMNMITVLLITLLFLHPVDASGQQDERTGTITGRITDRMTGGPLPAANIFVVENAAGAATNDRGVYIIRSISPGTYTLRISYIGYQTAHREVFVPPGGNVSVDIILEETYITTDEVVVTELARGHARAFMEQREADIHKQIITTEQMERFGDVNLAESLMRLPGISVSYEMGEAAGIAIRGMGMNRNLVQVDGVPMASTSEGGRETNIETMSGEMISSVEVIRVPTPDMPADALGGIINLRTARPVAGRADFRLLTTGEYSNMSDRIGPRTSLRYSQGFGKFGLSIQGEYRRVYNDEDRLDLQWLDSPWGPTIEYTSTRYRIRDSERYGVSGRLLFEPNQRTSFFISGLYNLQDNINSETELRLSPGDGLVGKTDEGLYFVQASTAPPGTRSGIGGRAENRNFYEIEGRRQLSTTFGGEHVHNLFNLDYKFTYAQGVRRIDLNRLVYWRNDRWATYLIDNNDYKFPRFTFLKHNPADEQVSVYNFNLWDFERMRDEIRNSTHFSYIGNINVEVPISIGDNKDLRIKFGSNYEYNEKYRRYAHFNYHRARSGLQYIPIGPFLYMDTRDFFGNPDLMRGPRIDFDSWNRWFAGDEEIDFSIYDPLGRFIEQDRYPFDIDAYNQNLDKNYDLTEGFLAGYLMGTLRIDNTTLITGLRVEHTHGSYEGLHTLELPDYDRTRVVYGLIDEKFSFTDYFPSFHVRHNFTEYTIFRGALTYGMKRASFTDLVPSRDYFHLDRIITGGNPELKPEKSIKIDFSIEHFFGNVGQISAGAYFNEYKDFIYTRSIILLEGEYRGWEERTPVNGLHAHYYGIELSWQQPLTYLPGYLNGLGIFTNYTYLVSRAEIERPFLRTIQMPGLRPWELNLGLSYDIAGFSGLIVANFIPEYMTHAAARAIGGVEMDRYQSSEMTIDITIRQRITRNIRFALDFKNITNTPRNDRYLVPADPEDIRIRYLLDNDRLPRYHEDYRLNGWYATAGLRFDF